jgi:dephospho-CoA kinase
MTETSDDATHADSDDTFAIVGLTGNIAGGKTTVADMFTDRGVPVLDADELAREIVEPGRPAYRDIRETFGDEVIADDGTLDREALGDIVFDDEEARDELESITHPRIAMRMRDRAQQLRDEGHDWVIYDAALIVENDLHHGLDSLIVVAADRDVRLERLVARDDLDRSEAEARFGAQLPQRDKIRVADWVIDNNGSLDETRRQVERLYDLFEHGLEQCGTTRRDVLDEHGFDVPTRSFD